MEEEVGFEPTERVNVRQFSRLLQSTALALLQGVWIHLFYTLNFYCQHLMSEKFSRFVSIAKIWSGTLPSKTIEYCFVRGRQRSHARLAVQRGGRWRRTAFYLSKKYFLEALGYYEDFCAFF